MSADERGRLRELLHINLRSVRACLLKEQFQRFWTYSSSRWADKFPRLMSLCRSTLRGNIAT
jgi:transposase